MKLILFLVTIFFTTICIITHDLQAMEHKRKTVTIVNNNTKSIIVHYTRNDPGFSGAHRIIKEKIELKPGENDRISVIKNSRGCSKIDFTIPGANTEKVTITITESQRQINVVKRSEYIDIISNNYTIACLSVIDRK